MRTSHGHRTLWARSAMMLGTFGRHAAVLLLVGTVAVSATGCVLVPYPVGGHGHYDHHGH